MSRLYKILGLRKDASNAEIKSAYYRKAKETHPDAGCNAEAFQEVTKAFHVLCDGQRRLVYDETGEEEQKPRIEDAAVAILRNLVEGLISDQSDPIYSDLAAEMRRRIGEAISQGRKQIAAISSRIVRCEQLAQRFTTRRADNIVKAMLESRIAEMRRQIEAAERQIVELEAAKRLTEDYSYRTDERERMSYNQFAAQSAAGLGFLAGANGRGW